MPSESHSGLARRRCLLVPAISGLFIIMLLAVAAGALQFSNFQARIEGAVYAQHGEAIPNARVRLESEEGDEVFETGLTDQGRYAFGGLRRAVYHLVVTADGYQTSRQTVDLTRSPSHTVVDIVMTVLGGEVTGLDPPSLTDAKAPRKARKEYQQGLDALAANQIPEAKVHFARAVQEYPCYARAQTAASLGLISDRDVKGAENALKKAIDCDPGFPSAYLKLGELYNAELRFADGQKILEGGLRLQPGSWKFHYHLGAAYFGQGEYAKAEAEYLRSESLTPPAPPDVHVKLADLYSKQKSYDRAYQEMQAYLLADPNGRFADKVKDVMHQMKTLTPVNPAPLAIAAPPSDAKP